MSSKIIAETIGSFKIKEALSSISKKILYPIAISSSLMFIPSTALANIDSLNLQTADSTVFTDKVVDNYHPSKPMLVYTGSMDNLLNSGIKLYEHSMFLYTKNPFDGQSIKMAINAQALPQGIGDELDDPYSKTQGSYWHESNPELSAFIKIDNTHAEQERRVKEVVNNVLLDYEKGIIPTTVARTKDEVRESLSVFLKYDTEYTLFHEFAHTFLLALNKVDLNNMAELDSHINNKEKYLEDYDDFQLQIKESVADMSSVIYLQKHGMIKADEVEKLIKGIMLSRLENTVWFEENLDWTTSAGDVGHNTIPALLSLLELYKNDKDAFIVLDDSEIITVAENIIWELVENGNPFLDKAELKNNIANDKTITHLENVYKSEVASLKAQSPNEVSDNNVFITAKAREHQNEYLKSYFEKAQAIATSAMRGFDINQAKVNTGTKYHTLRDISGNILNNKKQIPVMDLYNYSKKVAITAQDPKRLFSPQEIESLVLEAQSKDREKSKRKEALIKAPTIKAALDHLL